MPKRTSSKAVVAIPADIIVSDKKKTTTDLGMLDKMLTPGWAQLEKQEFAKVERSARAMLAKEPIYLYAYSQLIDALAGQVAAGKTELRVDLCKNAWKLLALSRRGVDGFHEEYWKLYQQKAATMLASIALVAPELVSVADAKKLIAEAKRVPIEEDDQMHMTGRWDTAAVADQLAER